MIEKYFVEYTGIEVKYFRDTLLQPMENVKKSVFERARHQRQYDRRVNKRLMQTQESTIDMGKAVHADLVVTESSGTESEVQVDNSRSGNDTDAEDAVIKPIYDEEPLAKNNESGSCDLTVYQKACVEYAAEYDHDFTLETCWEILKDHSAWKEV
nr:hypothetical protein [Tanacetum cinerariifolium]